MSHPQLDDAFARLGALPEESRAQLSWLKRLVEVFHQAPDPRIKALRRQLDEALLRLSAGHEEREDPAELGRDFAARIERLRHDTFDTLLTIINQVRGTLRIKLAGGMPKAARAEAERLQDGLSHFSRGLRQVLLGAQSGDAAAEQAGQKLIDQALRALDGKL